MSNVIVKVSRIHFGAKGIKWHPVFLAKIMGFIYRKRADESKKCWILGKITGANVSSTKEIVNLGKILSDTTRNATVLVTNTNQLFDRIESEFDKVQEERLRVKYAGNIVELSEAKRTLSECMNIIITRQNRRKFMTQRYLFAFSDKSNFHFNEVEKISNEYFDAERSKLDFYFELIETIETVLNKVPKSHTSNLSSKKEVDDHVVSA